MPVYQHLKQTCSLTTLQAGRHGAFSRSLLSPQVQNVDIWIQPFLSHDNEPTVPTPASMWPRRATAAPRHRWSLYLWMS